jgi:signal transduction histidine kinase
MEARPAVDGEGMARELAHEPRAFLSTVAAGRSERRVALTVVLLSVGIFLATAPFARTPLPAVWAFLPIYQSALVVNEVITAVLLFGQFSILRSRALLVLASAYLFSALMAVAHGLSFPGLFAPTGLLGAGAQTTAWLYFLWHGGFPLLVIAYALTEEGGETRRRAGSGRVAMLSAIGAVLLVVGALTLITTAGHGALPVIMQANQDAPAKLIVAASTWMLCLLALAVLWRRRSHSMLDLWLMVVLCAWIFDIALAAVLNHGRFDVGWYAGRVYGLLAASFVLVVLLVENAALYARLVRAHLELDRQNRSLEETVRERTARLLQSEKVATMGSLLAGVAHELNNPLAVVMGQSTLLRESATDPGSIRRADKIVAGAERCVRIVRNFLALARQQPPSRGQVQLNRVVHEAVELLAYELRTDGVEVSLQLADALPALWADGHQLHQVLVNLLANAHHAMRASRAPRRVTITTRHDAGASVTLDVADSGPGIPAELHARIFEPFFTTKPVGQGTGLGLSLCRGIIEEHGGALTVASAPGQGARFTITLPVLVRPEAAATPLETDAPRPTGPRAILVIDDEAEIAAVLAEMFARDGHRTDTVSNGAEALQQLARHAYDLVLSDTRMPIMDGAELYRELVRRFPALRQRIIFLTGDVLDPEKRRFLESTGAPVMMKPFDLNDVRRLVHRMLAGTSQEAR